MMNKTLRGVIGNIKHENMHLEEDEKKMLLKLANKEITEKQFDNWALKKVMG